MLTREFIQRVLLPVVAATMAVTAAAYEPLSGYRVYSEAVAMGNDGEATVTLLLDNATPIKRAFHVEVTAPEGYYFKGNNGSWAAAQGGIGSVDQWYDAEARLLRLLFTSADAVPAGTGRAIATLRLASDPEATTIGRTMTVSNLTFVRATGAGGHNGVDATVTVTPSAASIGLSFSNATVSANMTYVKVSFTATRAAGLTPGRCGVYVGDAFHAGRVVSSTATTCTVQCDSIGGLMPGTKYLFTPFVTIDGDGYRGNESSFTTRSVSFSDECGSTQTTITPRFRVSRDGGFVIDSYGVTVDGIDYAGTIVSPGTSADYVVQCPTVTGLNVNSSYYVSCWVTYKGQTYSRSFTVSTRSIGISTSRTMGPTTARVDASYSAGDARVRDAYFTFNGNKSRNLRLTGLKPKTSYSATYTVETATGSQSENISFTTGALEMTTQTARMLSNTSPMFIALTNIADEETSCGFEWRRIDAPDLVPSATVYCPVYGGTMAGTLKNMTENIYYKFRPFYKASDGTMYYGEWMGFLTADASVGFDPVVYTYTSPEVTMTGATLSGVALRGSSEITSQGFEYWLVTGGSHAAAKAPSSGVTRVTATGERMSVTVDGLRPGATYRFRSFVEAGGATTYGAEVEFITDRPSYDVNSDSAIDVGDVNAVLGDILTGGKTALYDVNADGTVDVGDVNAILAEILKQ